MKITSKDLRIKAKSALDAVRRGEKVEITYHGKVVAMLVSPEPVQAQEIPSELPGFGIWSDRDDVGDSHDYVRNLRRPRYSI